jgi:hypothetical protein
MTYDSEILIPCLKQPILIAPVPHPGDTAGHGESAWKVFTEGPGETLSWFRDADDQGNFIDPNLKWKSPGGATIR